jgi:hypothetical protein
MPQLTRRRSTETREECWHIYYGDVRVGTIALRSAQPARHRSMAMGLRLLSELPSGRTSDRTTASFEEARADFEEAGRFF